MTSRVVGYLCICPFGPSSSIFNHNVVTTASPGSFQLEYYYNKQCICITELVLVSNLQKPEVTVRHDVHTNSDLT